MNNNSVTPTVVSNIKIGTANSIRSTTQQYKECLVTLDRNARLFAKRKDGTLQRIDASEAKQRLDDGQTVSLVKGLGKEIHTKNKNESSYNDSMGFFDYKREESAMSSRAKEVNVVYTVSQLKNWSDLDYADTKASGVPGTPTLLQSGGKALISYSWEETWSNRTSSKNAKLLTIEYSGSTTNTHETDSYTPDE